MRDLVALYMSVIRNFPTEQNRSEVWPLCWKWDWWMIEALFDTVRTPEKNKILCRINIHYTGTITQQWRKIYRIIDKVFIEQAECYFRTIWMISWNAPDDFIIFNNKYNMNDIMEWSLKNDIISRDYHEECKEWIMDMNHQEATPLSALIVYMYTANAHTTFHIPH